MFDQHIPSYGSLHRKVPSLLNGILSTQFFSVFLFRFFFDMDHFESYYWICYSIASILCFGFWPGGMWDFSCLTRDQTHTLALVGKVLSTGWPGKSVYLLLICWMSWKLDDFF